MAEEPVLWDRTQLEEFPYDRANVALLLESEALVSGLEALLKQIGRIDEVLRTTPENAAEDAASGRFDVVMVSFHQWHVLEPFAGRPRGGASKILVIGDDLHTRDATLFGTLPADGFLTISDLSAERLADTLDRVLQGDMPMPPQLSRHLLSGPRSVIPGPHERAVNLTPREMETLGLLAEGLSNKQLARALGISTHGAKRLVAALFLKLGANNRTAVVVTAMKAGLV